MPNIADLLGALGAPAASILHGYLGGQVGAEQYRQKLKAAQAGENYKQQQVDIAKQHQKFLEDEAARKPLEDAKKRVADVLDKMHVAFLTDPKAQETLHARGPHAVQDWENFYNSAQATVNDPSSDFKKLQEIYKNPAFQHFDALGNQPEAQQPEVSMPAAPSPSTPSQSTPNSQSLFNKMAMLNGQIPQFNLQAANQDLSAPQSPETPTPLSETQPSAGAPIPGPSQNNSVDNNGYGLTESQILARRKQAGVEAVQGSTIAKNKAQTNELIAKYPFISDEAKSLIRSRNAAAGQAETITGLLKPKYELDVKKNTEFNDRWAKQFKFTSGNAQREFNLKEKLANITQYTAEGLNALHEAEIGNLQLKGSEIAARLDAMQKIDPNLKLLIQALPAAVQADIFGDKEIAPEVAGVIARVFSAAGNIYGQALTPGGVAPANPLQGSQGIQEGEVRDFQGQRYFYQNGNWLPAPPNLPQGANMYAPPIYRPDQNPFPAVTISHSGVLGKPSTKPVTIKNKTEKTQATKTSSGMAGKSPTLGSPLSKGTKAASGDEEFAKRVYKDMKEGKAEDNLKALKASGRTDLYNKYSKVLSAVK